MTAAQFLAVLERDKLIAPATLASLRHQVDTAHDPISPVAIAKLLVFKGKLHWLKAQQLLPQEDFKPAPGSEEAELAAENALIASQVVKTSTESLEAQFGLAPEKPAASIAPTLSPRTNAASVSGSKIGQQPAPPKSPPSAQQVRDAQIAANSGLGSRSAAIDLDEELVAAGGSHVLDGLEELLGESGIAAVSGLGATATSSKAMSGKGLKTAVPLAAPAVRAGARSAPKWIWIVGGVLGVLLIGGAIATALLLRGTGDEAFQAAEADFSQQAYGPACEKYTELLAAYPHHSQANTARVHRAAAQIRLANTARPDWPTLLGVARTQLGEVCELAEYAAHSAEMTKILTSMANGLCVRAEKTDVAVDPASSISDVRAALALLGDDRMVPPNERPWQQMESIEDRLQLVEHRAKQTLATEQAITSVRTALQAAQTAPAYATLAELRSINPQVADSPPVADLREQLAQLHLASAQPTHDKLAAAKQENKTAVLGSLTPCTAHGRAIAVLRGQQCFATIQEAVYALDAASGKLLWRRHVGLDAQWLFLPGEKTSRVVLFAPGQREVACLQAASGKLLWRFELPAALAGRVLPVGDKLFVATQTGQVISLDAAKGESNAQLQLPLPLALGGGMVAGRDGASLYVLAAEGVLFSLATADLSTRAAVAAGVLTSRTLPPILIDNTLLLIENRADDEARLLPIPLDKAGAARTPLEALPLSTAVMGTPTLATGKLVLPTVGGEFLTCETTNNVRTPLKAASPLALANASQIGPQNRADRPAPHLLAAGRDLFIAAHGLSHWSLQSNGRATSIWSSLAESDCQQPQVLGEYLIVTRHVPDAASCSVAAVAAETGAPVWQAQFAAPLIEAFVTGESNQFTLINATGSLHTAALESSPRVAPTAANSFALSTAHEFAVPLANTAWLLGATGSSTIEYVTNGAAHRTWTLPGKLACRPHGFGPGVLAALQSGVIVLVDPPSGKLLAAPLIPKTQVGVNSKWQILASSEGNEPTAVLCDGTRKLYRITLTAGPDPQLRLDAQHETELARGARGIALGSASKTLILVDGQHTVWSCDRESLQPGKQWPLPGTAIVWGPYPAGDIALLATDREELYAFAADGQRWKAALDVGPLVGKPLVTAGGIIVLAARGQLLRLDPKTGSPLAKIEVGQSLAFGPVILGDTVAVGAADGTLLKINLP